MDFFIQAHDAMKRVAGATDNVQHITAFISEEKLKYGLYCCIVGFLSVALVVLFMILLRRTILIRQAKIAKILRNKYETLLSELMSYIYENGKIFERKELSVFLNHEDKTRAFNRKILLEQILLMKKHVSGEEASVLTNYYKKLGFEKDALKKLKSWSWYVRFEGLDELILMETTAINSIFHHMTKDKHQLVRVAALRALILRGGDWQPTLIRYNYPLSPWEQYQICDALSKKQAIQLPDFTPLLKSLNPTVVKFALKMIQYFHSFDAVPSVVPLLKSENQAIVEAATDVMKQFGMDEEELVSADLEAFELV